MRIAPVVLAAALASPALAASRTQIIVDPPIPAQPRYSQAVAVTVHLSHSDGSPVVGTGAGSECGAQPCRVNLLVAPAVGAQTFLIDAVVDVNGTANARVPFVDGSLNPDVVYAVDDTGAPYVLTAKFLGTGAGVVAANPDCDPANPEVVDGDLCLSEGSVPVSLFAETSTIALGQGLEGAIANVDCDPAVAGSCPANPVGAPLGCEPTLRKCGIVLSATVTDPNGLADEGGTEVDGTSAVKLVGVSVTFFYDADNNGRPDASETISTAVTNAGGVASVIFPLDPAFVRAGTYEKGIDAEYGGDTHYGVARASTRLVIHPADVDVSRTVIEADPDSLAADGFARSTLRARLVDAFNNPLDANSDPHDVVFTTDLGLLNAAVVLDPLDGTYTQVLQAQRRAGTATVKVTVDGVDGPTKTVIFTGNPGGCHCGNAGPDGPALVVVGAGLALVVRRKRRQREPR